MTASAFLENNPNPTEEDIKNAMHGNICRCGTYNRIYKAVEKAAEKWVKKHCKMKTNQNTTLNRRAFMRNTALAGGGMFIGFNLFKHAKPKVITEPPVDLSLLTIKILTPL